MIIINYLKPYNSANILFLLDKNCYLKSYIKY